MTTDLRRDPSIARLTYTSIAGSLLVGVALVAVHMSTGSELALAQAADSASDTFSGAALAWAVKQASQPADADHPLGHARAEPLAALVVALLAGVLSVEVLRGAIVSLVTHAEAELDWPVAAVFTAKIAFKSAIVAFAGRTLRRRENPALSALRVDARNDVLVGGVSLAGFMLARWRLPAVDAWLAIAIGIYVGLSGVRLARENLRFVMSEAAPASRHDELVRVASNVAGVHGVDLLIATWSGSRLHLYVEIAVDGGLAVRAAHDVAHAVEQRLMDEDDVAHVVVHVNSADGPSSRERS